ncbi:MAG: DUF1294 domain-containing protein [Clostridia bacterium]|nr:DUF1294 domain-containing protein [Clostridia bacterium]
MEPISLYLAIVSVMAVVICCYDKIASRSRKRRIREKTLLFVAAFGGSVAMYLTMGIIRHKTRHNKFMVGLPLMIVIQALLVFLIYYKIL